MNPMNVARLCRCLQLAFALPLAWLILTSPKAWAQEKQPIGASCTINADCASTRCVEDPQTTLRSCVELCPAATEPGNPVTLDDCDGDGLPNTLEDRNGNGVVDARETDPLEDDTDGDGLSDGVEDTNRNGIRDSNETDPRDVDTDAGGASDGRERVDGTDPLDPSDDRTDSTGDQDEDGLPDSIEDANGNGAFDEGETDFTNPDTDGDGIIDGQEDRNANGVVDTAETDPRLADTDSDGDPDLEEIRRGTDPLEPDISLFGAGCHAQPNVDSAAPPLALFLLLLGLLLRYVLGKRRVAVSRRWQMGVPTRRPAED